MNQFKSILIVAIVVPVLLLAVGTVGCVLLIRGRNRRQPSVVADVSNRKELPSLRVGNTYSEIDNGNVRYLGCSMFNHHFLPVADYRRKLYEHRMMVVPEVENEQKADIISNETSRYSPHKFTEKGAERRTSNNAKDENNLQVKRKPVKTKLEPEREQRSGTRTRPKFGALFFSNFIGNKSSISQNKNLSPCTHKKIAPSQHTISPPISKFIPNLTSSTATETDVNSSTIYVDNIDSPPRISLHLNQTSSLLSSDLQFDKTDNSSAHSFTHSTRSYQKFERFSRDSEFASAASIDSGNSFCSTVNKKTKALSRNCYNSPKGKNRLQTPLFNDNSTRSILKRRSSLTHQNRASLQSIIGSSPLSSIKKSTIMTASHLDKPLPDRPNESSAGRQTSISRLLQSPVHSLPAAHRRNQNYIYESHPLEIGKKRTSSCISPSSFKSSPQAGKKRSIFTEPDSDYSPATLSSAVTAKSSLSSNDSDSTNSQKDGENEIALLPIPATPMAVERPINTGMSSISYSSQPAEEGIVAVVEQICRVTTPFKPKLYDELTLHRDTKIIVFKLFDDGWCTAQYLDDYLKGNKSHGVCPQACLTPI